MLRVPYCDIVVDSDSELSVNGRMKQEGHRSIFKKLEPGVDFGVQKFVFPLYNESIVADMSINRLGCVVFHLVYFFLFRVNFFVKK